MRLIFKVLGVIAAITVLIPLIFLAWVYFYTGGPPDVTVLQALAPPQTTQATLPYCDKSASSTAIPAYEMARFRDALIAAEGDPNGMHAIRNELRAFVIDKHPRPMARYSRQIASQVYCLHAEGIMSWHLNTLRTTVQIERRYKPDAILTIYANSAYFGNETYGIENASQKYFKKKALQLSVGEGAFLAGLIQSPTRFLKHPDKAIERRNVVLDHMAALQMISSAEAEKSKSQPLGITE